MKVKEIEIVEIIIEGLKCKYGFGDFWDKVTPKTKEKVKADLVKLITPIIAKQLSSDYKKGFDEWFINESIESDTKTIFFNGVPLNDGDTLIDIYENGFLKKNLIKNTL